MPAEIIAKKLEQIKELMGELTRLLKAPLSEFMKDMVVIRAAERNFQLMVDLAVDVNTQLLQDRNKPTPDTYRQSFLYLAKENLLDASLAEQLSITAKLRNILVHEYDFEEDFAKFYVSVKKSLPWYEKYITDVLNIIK